MGAEKQEKLPMPQRILLIDDSKAIHALLASRLSDEPVTLTSAYTGQEGLAAARKFTPDLILLDADLPDASAIEICRQIKSDITTADIPVIFLASAASPDDRIYDPEVGAADFINKPFNFAELKARIRAALQTREPADGLESGPRIDGPSGLWNRAYFDQRFCQELSLARRTGNPLTCILADIDNFASTNQTYGRAFGDEVLARVAAALSDATRLEDDVCRFGPDEFIILCPCTDRGGAESVIQCCRESLAALDLKCEGHPVPITCTFGAAQDDGQKLSLIKSAEAGLQLAKSTYPAVPPTQRLDLESLHI
jgi:two-component system, cell cycle response regulator